MLAGLPKAPSAYNPIANPKRATVRQQYIIERMLDNGFITAEQVEAARQQSCATGTPSEPACTPSTSPRRRASWSSTQYGEETYTRGLNVHLTIDAADQEVAYRALRRGLMDYERRQVYRGPEAYVDLPRDAKAASTRASPRRWPTIPTTTNCCAAVVLEASPKKVVAVLQSGESITVTGEGLNPVTSGLSRRRPRRRRSIRRGAVVRAVQDAKGDWTLTQLPEVEGAFVSLRPARRRDPRAGRRLRLSTRASSTTSRRRGASRARASSRSSIRRRWRRASRPTTVVNDAPLFFDADSHRQPAVGAEELRRQVRGPDVAATGAGQVEEHGVDPHPAGDRPRRTRRNGSPASASSRQAPGLPDDGAGRRRRSRRCRWPAPTACSPTAATASSRS